MRPPSYADAARRHGLCPHSFREDLPMDERKDDFVGRHLIVDASTYTRRNLSSTDTVFALFEALNRNLDMTAILPPIVCRYPFANDEIASFCTDVETALAAKANGLSLEPVRVMRD